VRTENTKAAGFMGLLLILLSVTACSDHDTGTAAPKYQKCHRLDLVDPETGKTLRGAEDLVWDQVNNRIIFSAYDRWALERAVREKRPVLPTGGLYSLPLSPGWSNRQTAQVVNLSSDFAGPGSFNPHGLDVKPISRGRTIVAAVNRGYVSESAAKAAPWRKIVTLDIFALTGDRLRHLSRIGSPELCRANDVAILSANRFAVTTDRAACGGFGAVRENVVGSRSGAVRIVSVQGSANQTVALSLVAGGIGFANGIGVRSAGPNTTFWVAATRDKALIELVSRRTRLPFRPPDAPEYETELEMRHYPLPAAPDNVTLTADAALVIAAHPSLFRLAAYRYQRFAVKRAPSLILEWTPATGAVQALFEDATGDTFSAATAAVKVGDILIIGSVADRGFLVCSKDTKIEGES